LFLFCSEEQIRSPRLPVHLCYGTQDSLQRNLCDPYTAFSFFIRQEAIRTSFEFDAPLTTLDTQPCRCSPLACKDEKKDHSFLRRFFYDCPVSLASSFGLLTPSGPERMMSVTFDS
jgi:hypothetical protein